MMLKGKKGVLPIAGQIGGIMRGMGPIAGAVGGAVPSGLGFGIGSKLMDVPGRILSNATLGLQPLIIAIVFDFLIYFLGSKDLLFGIVAHIVLTFVLINNVKIQSKFLSFFLIAKVGGLVYLFAFAFFQNFIPVKVHQFMMLSFLNPALFAFTIYIIFTGVIENRAGGGLVKVIYWLAFFAAVFFIYDHLNVQLTAALSQYGVEVPEPSQEQLGPIYSFVNGLVSSTKNHAWDVARALANAPTAAGDLLSGRVKQAGGDALFGQEKKEQPKLGIVIKDHPRGFTGTEDTKEFKAILLVENLPPQEFLEISDIKCTNKDKTASVRPDEFKGKLMRGEKVKIFYNSPMTVSCTFTKTKYSQMFDKTSGIDLYVQYDFETNAKLTSYVMREDLLEELLIKNEEPLDFMAVPPAARNPTTFYDNGPAKVGMGPTEILNPPLGVAQDKVYPDFELILGNKAEFNGKISKVNEISVTMPDGFELINPETCPFHATSTKNQYITSAETIEKNKLKFTNIGTQSRLFTCDMAINPEEALKDASFAQVEFDVFIDFTYEATKSIPETT